SAARYRESLPTASRRQTALTRLSVHPLPPLSAPAPFQALFLVARRNPRPVAPSCAPAGRGSTRPAKLAGPWRYAVLALSHDWITQDTDIVDFDLHDIAILHILRVTISDHQEHVSGIQR